MEKAATNGKRLSVFKAEIVKCYIWSVEFYSAEPLILRKVDHKYMERFEM